MWRLLLYGVPRATFDLDILIEADLTNARSLLKALHEAGLGTAEMITAEEIVSNAITIFEDRVHLDVMTQIPGLNF